MHLRSLAITLALTGALAGCAQELPEQPYSADAAAFRDMLAGATDFDSRLALARLYFEHNQLDAADSLLRELTAQDPDHAVAAAWHGANDCKLAGRAQPWLMGLRKLYLVRDCLRRIEAALTAEPDSIDVRLIYINTAAAVAMFDSLTGARAELDRLMVELTDEAAGFPPSVEAHTYLAAAEVTAAEGDIDTATAHLQRVIALGVDASTVNQAQARLAGLRSGT